MVRGCLAIDISLDHFERRSPAGNHEVARGPEGIAPEPLQDFRQPPFTQISRGSSFQTLNDFRERKRRWVADHDMNVVPVRLNGNDLDADRAGGASHGGFQEIEIPGRDDPASVFGREHQMSMEQ